MATLLVRDYGTKAVGAIYPFFSVLAILGMFISTKIHRDGGIDESSVQMANVENSGSGKQQLNPVC